MLESMAAGSWQEIAAIAALFSAVSTAFAWVAGRRSERAKTSASIKRDRAEAETQRILSISAKESAKEFETAVNERVVAIIDEQRKQIATLTEHIDRLQEKIEQQAQKIDFQAVRIGELTEQVHCLNQELEAAKQARSTVGQGE